MEGKTSRPDFNNAGQLPKPASREIPRIYSHKQILSKIDGYTSVAKTPQDKTAMQEIKKTYVQEETKKDQDRLLRDGYLKMGMHSEIHTGNAPQQIAKDDALRDQHDRRTVMKNVKSYYHRHYSLSRSFTNPAKGKEKDKHMDKG